MPFRGGAAAKSGGIAFALLLGCMKTYPSGITSSELTYGSEHPVPRDPKNAGAKFDRDVAYRSEVSKKRATGEPPAAYLAGDCTATSNPDLQKFCLGKYTEMTERDLVYFAYGTAREIFCLHITDKPLQDYCTATASSDGRGVHSCDTISKRDSPEEKYVYACYAFFGDDWNKWRDLPRGGGGGSSSTTASKAPSTPAPKAACRRKGAIVASADECCEGTAEYASKASDADRKAGREMQCTW